MATEHVATDSVPGSPAPGLPAPENLGEAEPPHAIDYGAINVTYLALLAALAYTARDRGDELGVVLRTELVPIGAATFALAKTVAHERVGMWLREPFVDETRGRRRLRGSRMRRAVGELVTCTRCVGAWSALGLVGLRVLHRPSGRAVTGVLATAALNDFLQAGFRALCKEANARGGQ
jgi:Protein of unknown function (DUF1360)